MNKPKLKLIQGGYSKAEQKNFLGVVTLVPDVESNRPFPIEALAYEEDTYLVLSADHEVKKSEDHIIKIMTKVIEMKPETPGSVVVKGKCPVRLLAIIHDFDKEPSWTDEWIYEAIVGILENTNSLKLRSLGLPLIGTKYGSISSDQFITQLTKAVENVTLTTLKRIWLITPESKLKKVKKILEL